MEPAKAVAAEAFAVAAVVVAVGASVVGDIVDAVVGLIFEY